MDRQSSNQVTVANAHEKRLKDRVYFTMASMRTMERDTVEEILDHFSVNRQSLSEQIPDLKRHDTVALGQQLQEEAMGHYEDNLQKGYALWLTGAWLESVKQTSPAGYEVYALLNALSPEQLSGQAGNQTSLKDRPVFQGIVRSGQTDGWLGRKGLYNVIQRSIQGWLSMLNVRVPVVKIKKSDR
jgi:hypothetical protein